MSAYKASEPTQHNHIPSPSTVSRCFKDIESKRVTWLWRSRLASKANVIGGQPGVGKSQLTCAIIATVTTGGRWPDHTPCELGSAIVVTSEDDAGDTVKPRLQAAGADVSKVHILDGVLKGDDLIPWTVDHVEELEQLILEQRDTRLVVIDPISAYMGRYDSHNTAEVRGALSALTELADRRKVCILMVTHLNKSIGGGAVERFNGSTAFVAVSRSAWLVGPDPENDDRRIMAPVKNNLGDDKQGFAYRIESRVVDKNIETSAIVWEGATDTTAVDVLRGPVIPLEDPENQSARAEAARFLIEQLRHGRQKSTAVFKAAEEAGIPESTLKRAKKQIGVISVKDGGWWKELADSKSKGAN